MTCISVRWGAAVSGVNSNISGFILPPQMPKITKNHPKITCAYRKNDPKTRKFIFWKKMRGGRQHFIGQIHKNARKLRMLEKKSLVTHSRAHKNTWVALFRPGSFQRGGRLGLSPRLGKSRVFRFLCAHHKTRNGVISIIGTEPLGAREPRPPATPMPPHMWEGMWGGMGVAGGRGSLVVERFRSNNRNNAIARFMGRAGPPLPHVRIP